MEKRILIPTDFSKNALNAARYALDLYRDFHCQFYFLNAFQVKVYSIHNMMVPEPGDRAYEAAKLESEKGLDKLDEMLHLREISAKHQIHKISSYNTLLEAVKNTIKKRDIDLVVMGTKGLTGSESVIFGTNTVNIMEKITKCPVLAVPETYSFEPPKEIVFPTDYKTDFKRRELDYLLEICRGFNAKIHVLHIEKRSSLSKTQTANKILLEEILHDYNYENHLLKNTKVHEGIQAFTEEHHCDLLAFINKKHLFFGSILSNPLVKELGYEATVPILTLNDHS